MKYVQNYIELVLVNNLSFNMIIIAMKGCSSQHGEI